MLHGRLWAGRLPLPFPKTDRFSAGQVPVSLVDADVRYVRDFARSRRTSTTVAESDLAKFGLARTCVQNGLEHLCTNALRLGGRCISNNYTKLKTKAMWECNFGHTWQATPANVLFCSCKGAPIGLPRSHDQAALRGVRCLATQHTNLHPKVGVMQPPKAPRKLGLVDLQAHATSKGGLCLGTEYINAKTKTSWQCKAGHIWEATPASLLYSGSWCPYCAKRAPLSAGRLLDHAASYGGQCLSSGYMTSRTRLSWKCRFGHVWQATAQSVLYRRSWCPVCAGNLPIGLPRLQAHAASLGGECLATSYRNAKTKVLWRCRHGHTWQAAPHNVLHHRTWCPTCAAATWRNESEVRQLLEVIFQPIKFDISFPAFLNGLQLDGYSPQLRLAFEYQGEQHYNPCNYFHFGDFAKFQRQQERDARKELLCAQRGVRLLVVPYFVKDKRTYIQLALLQWFRISEINPLLLAE